MWGVQIYVCPLTIIKAKLILRFDAPGSHICSLCSFPSKLLSFT